MRRYLLDTGIAACYIDRRLGVFERAQTESSQGNQIGIAHPVLGELVYRFLAKCLPDWEARKKQLESIVL